MSEEAGVRRAIARLHDAMNRVVSGDVSAMKALCSHREDVTGFYGWGAYEKGWHSVTRTRSLTPAVLYTLFRPASY